MEWLPWEPLQERRIWLRCNKRPDDGRVELRVRGGGFVCATSVRRSVGGANLFLVWKWRFCRHSNLPREPASLSLSLCELLSPSWYHSCYIPSPSFHFGCLPLSISSSLQPSPRLLPGSSTFSILSQAAASPKRRREREGARPSLALLCFADSPRAMYEEPDEFFHFL